MEKLSKRGKIPQRDWPSIIKRYEAGETLTSIARTYACSPPAISYVLSRSREASARSREQGTMRASEPRPTKPRASEASAEEEAEEITEAGNIIGEAEEAETPGALDPLGREASRVEPAINGAKGVTDSGVQIVTHAAGDTDQHVGPHDRDPPPERGSSPPAPDPRTMEGQAAEPRRTLHLSLSKDGARPSNLSADGDPPDASAARPWANQERREYNRTPENPMPHAFSVPGESAGVAERPPKEGGAFLDQALRERVDGDISAFLAAFDAALAQDTVESRAGLREATDRLLRAGARMRIQLERLEARVPLSTRDHSEWTPPTWRPR